MATMRSCKPEVFVNIRRYPSKDNKGTVKYTLEIPGVGSVEEVLVLHPGNYFSLCVSSSIGCPIHCLYCATGSERFRRMLRHDEIVSQIVVPTIYNDVSKPPDVISFMGMGEPLLNFDNVISAAKYFKENWSVKRLLLSTIGIPDRIIELPNHAEFELYLSLLSTRDAVRSLLIPFRPVCTVDELLDSLEIFGANSNKPVTISYLLLENINDRPTDAERLVNLVQRRNLKAKISLRRFCGNGTPFSASKRIDEFFKIIKESGLEVEIFDSKGRDIKGGCGQLAQQTKHNTQILLPELCFT